jgi:hypothetical protein
MTPARSHAVFGRTPPWRHADVPPGTSTTTGPKWRNAATGTNANLNLESRFAGSPRHTA